MTELEMEMVRAARKEGPWDFYSSYSGHLRSLSGKVQGEGAREKVPGKGVRKNGREERK